MMPAGDVIKIGIIGLGHIGKYHIQALDRFSECQVVAACDLNPSLAGLLPASAAFTTDVKTLLANREIDTVIIATPNRTHFALANTALDAGKNVILEKPATTTLEEYKVLDRRFAEAQEHIYYAFHAAKSLDVGWFKQYYAQPDVQTRLGSITAFACHFYDPYVLQGQLKHAATGLGDSWVDSGINALSVLAEFLDLSTFKLLVKADSPWSKSEQTVQATATYRFKSMGLQESDWGAFTSAQGGLGTIDTNWTLGLNQKRTWLGFGTTGYGVLLDHSQQEVIESAPDGNQKLLKSCEDDTPRLLNHYLGVFDDYLICRAQGTFNNKVAYQAHRLLYC